MKRSPLLIALMLTSAMIILSCSKSSDLKVNNPDSPAHDTSTVTSIGTPVGQIVKKTITASGGTLTSSDGVLEVTIPAGALTEGKEISIQAITNQLPSGLGNAYRILPHGQLFSKPVTITFKYKTEDLEKTIAEFLDIAYQNEAGSWRALFNSTVDKNNKKISVTTTHFSDWSFFKSLVLEPAKATIGLNQNLDLEVSTVFPEDEAGNDGSFAIYRVSRRLSAAEIVGWKYQGEGILTSRAGKALYSSPDHVPTANPEAVSVEVKLKRKGQYMLVSNITVAANYRIDYLHVDEDWNKPNNNGKCILYMYGAFGNDPGAGKRSIKVGNTEVEVKLWTPSIVICAIDRVVSGEIIFADNGRVITRGELKKFHGKFLYERFHGGRANAGSAGALKETTLFTLVYRGFGAPCPSNVDPVFLLGERSLSDGTEARFELSGSASVTTPTQPCPSTTSVSLTASAGIQPMNPLSISGFSIFHAYVEDQAGGIQVKFDYNINDVITGVRVKRVSCGGASFDPPKPLGVGLEGFNNTAISLDFSGTAGLKLKGTDKLESYRMSSGILIEAWDGTGTPSHYETDGLMPATFKNQ